MSAADELLLDSPAARPCLHPRAGHQHGTYLAYQLDRCRCAECKDAGYKYKKRSRRTREKYGIWSKYADAAPIRARIEALMRGGMRKGTIATTSGVHVATIELILGRRPGKPPSRRVTQRTAEAILGVGHLDDDGLWKK